jgi:hypothetical protein
MIEDVKQELFVLFCLSQLWFYGAFDSLGIRPKLINNRDTTNKIYKRVPFLSPFLTPHSPNKSDWHHPSFPESQPFHPLSPSQV